MIKQPESEKEEEHTAQSAVTTTKITKTYMNSRVRHSCVI